MAPKAGTKPTTRRDDGTVEEVPGSIPRGRGGRPKIRELITHADGTVTESTTRHVTLTRASTLGKVLESDIGIQIWKQRMITFGLSRRPDYVKRAAAVSTTTADDDKAVLKEVAELALEHAKASAGATSGSALHALSERRDAGEDLSYLDSETLGALDGYSRVMAFFRVHMSETFVVCDKLSAAGTFDRLVSPLGIMTAPDGTTFRPGDLLIMDIKTSATADYFGPTYTCQQAVYGNGVPYTHRAGRAAWPGSAVPSSKWALILHVPFATPDESGMYWVDLTAGLELGHLANQVRGEKNRTDLITRAALPVIAPRVVESPALPGQVTALGVVVALRQAPDAATLDVIWEGNQAIWTEDMTRMAKARLRELGT